MKFIKQLSILSFLVLLIVSCKRPNIQESIWVKYITENCYDSISFSKSDEVEIYSCEIGEKYYGTYTISNDTITCKITKGQFDSDFPNNSRHKLKPFSIKYFI